MEKTVWVQTLGCKLNFAETSAMLQQLEQAGYRMLKPSERKAGKRADVCLVNTCSVTETADQKDRQAIHKLVREHPEAFVVVTGCYAQLKPQEIAAIPGVDLVLGADFKMDWLPYLKSEKNSKALILTSERNEVSHFLPACARGDRTRYFLKVQDGCDYFCSYCTVPMARGRSRNPSIESLVEQARQAVADGAREIVLSGVNVGTFGKSGGGDFLDLVRALDGVEGVERYRISSIEPNLLRDEIIEYVADSKHFMPHFHLPLQSGSNEVLKLMRRRYPRELFADKVALIRRLMPDAFIGVDVIAGMRGETEACFEDSRAFLASLPVSQLHVFTYSERPGTQALQIDYAVPPQEKKHRSEVLHALSEEKKRSFYASQQGRSLEVLFEHGRKNDCIYGFSENYIRVEAPWRKDWENTVQNLRVGDFTDSFEALKAVLPGIENKK